MPFGGYEHITHPRPDKGEAYQNYTCGYCGNNVTGFKVANYHYGINVNWLICPSCGEGSVCSSRNHIFPGISFGPVIEGLPELVLEAYTEARNCYSLNAFTATELICRKILNEIQPEKYRCY